MNHQINGEIIAMNGSEFNNDYADKCYVIIGQKKKKLHKKPYFNRHRLKINSSFRSPKDARFDTRFVIATIINIKKYKPKYISIAGYMIQNPIKKCINKEANA